MPSSVFILYSAEPVWVIVSIIHISNPKGWNSFALLNANTWFDKTNGGDGSSANFSKSLI